MARSLMQWTSFRKRESDLFSSLKCRNIQLWRWETNSVCGQIGIAASACAIYLRMRQIAHREASRRRHQGLASPGAPMQIEIIAPPIRTRRGHAFHTASAPFVDILWRRTMCPCVFQCFATHHRRPSPLWCRFCRKMASVSCRVAAPAMCITCNSSRVQVHDRFAVVVVHSFLCLKLKFLGHAGDCVHSKRLSCRFVHVSRSAAAFSPILAHVL